MVKKKVLTTKKKPSTKKPTTSKKKVLTVSKGQKTKKRTRIPTRLKKIQEIKQNLVIQRKELLHEAMEALNKLPGPIVFPDLSDQASAEIDRNFMLRLKGRERMLLKKIDEAIDRIDHDSFGICEKCGQEIDIRRLEARPVTTMCIDCKTQQEEEEKFMET
jgi:DnaK suppressor protein